MPAPALENLGSVHDGECLMLGVGGPFAVNCRTFATKRFRFGPHLPGGGLVDHRLPEMNSRRTGERAGSVTSPQGQGRGGRLGPQRSRNCYPRVGVSPGSSLLDEPPGQLFGVERTTAPRCPGKAPTGRSRFAPPDIGAEHGLRRRVILTVRPGQPRVPGARRRDRRIVQCLCSPSIRRPTRLGTSPRFIRRLVAERRIAFAQLGKHVRIDAADLDAFVAAGRVAPAEPPSVQERRDSTWEPGPRRAACQS